MVEDGLRDCIRKSRWKPSEEDLHAFTLACRELPVMASIRIREVILRTRHGRTLQTEFQYLLNLSDAPTNLDWEYLRILQRAYMPDSSAMPADVAKMYHLLVGTIIAARTSLSVYSMSQLLGIAEDEAQATLEPISSIIGEDVEGVKFYHATAKEFIMGDPIGNGNDKVDKEKWADFKLKWEQPQHIRYVINNLLDHLDPAQLFSQESNNNGLQNEFNSFLTQNFLTYLHMEGCPHVPAGFDEYNNHDVIELLQEGVAVFYGAAGHSWVIHRSLSLFCPPGSPLWELYGHLFEPVWVFGLSGKILSHLIQLSEASLNAQTLMEVKLDGWPKEVDMWGHEEINYEAEFHDPDVRNGIVTCAALSRDGRYIALGFGSGVIEIADIDDQHMITQFQNHPPNPPAWIEFIHGDIVLLPRILMGTSLSMAMGAPCETWHLPVGTYPVVTAVSDSGFFIVRVLRDPGKPWYNNMACIDILGDPHIQPLASPPSDSSIPSSQSNSESFPERHTVGFSPEAQYIAAFDAHSAFTWSTESVSTQPTLPLAGDTVHVHHSWVDAGPDLDKSWIKHPFFHHLPKNEWGYSFAAGRTLLVNLSGSGANSTNNIDACKDGTRFLLQGKMKAPIVVDIGKAAWYLSATLDYDFTVPSNYSPCSTSSDISSPSDKLSDDSFF
ncbi:uncharacterized protein EI90DRAFT_3135100 [Cantharellus anzutake]|uniref:uncharacterized protein n=1 Tax=Cantharellus anzutake TaxID=1750568 RepID=UPI001906708F|nr:uncharacterized protein EI90DRAFT_3135100 [Cantharellus anzutake]KAF8315565.1 hypothetical protein EI90DRAFT_3135100 [Cantharellus anzutake]